jgi:hypothetical protein
MIVRKTRKKSANSYKFIPHFIFSQIKELNFPKLTNPRTLPNMMTHNQIERMLAPIKSKSMIEKIQ